MFRLSVLFFVSSSPRNHPIDEMRVVKKTKKKKISRDEIEKKCLFRALKARLKIFIKTKMSAISHSQQLIIKFYDDEIYSFQVSERGKNTKTKNKAYLEKNKKKWNSFKSKRDIFWITTQLQTYRNLSWVHERKNGELQSCQHDAVTQQRVEPSSKALELIHLACLGDSSRHDFALHDRFWKYEKENWMVKITLFFYVVKM